MKNNIIFINKSLKVVFLKNKWHLKVYFFNKINFFSLLMPNSSIWILNKNLNFINLRGINSNLFILKKFLINLSFCFYKKLNFSGKGFKIKKNKDFILFNFNNSHIKAIIEKNIKFIKNSKNSLLFLYRNNNLKNNNLLQFILNLFRINIFTKKGIRLSKNIIFQKKIKKK